MKKYLFFSIILLFSTIFSPVTAFSKDKTETVRDSVSNFQETTYDKNGNKIQLKYNLNQKRLKVETFVNDKLFDYVTIAYKNGIYSNEIMYYKPKTSNKKINLSNSSVKKYYVTDFIKETDVGTNHIKSPQMTITKSAAKSSKYKYITSKYNSTLKVKGNLWGYTTKKNKKKYMFDFSKGAAISIVGAALTVMFPPGAVVSIFLLLADLGVGYAFSKLTTSLNGYYNATYYNYYYKVYVGKKVTYNHKQSRTVVYYYNYKNGKKASRSKRSASWASQNAIMNVGILAGA